MEDISLSLGRGCFMTGGNLQRDANLARAAFAQIKPTDGGNASLQPYDTPALIAAIEVFQRRWWPATRPSGMMTATDRTWLKIKALLGGAGAPAASASTGPFSFKLNKAQLFKQGDIEWRLQTMNRSAEARIWGKGCLLTCVASALAWKGVAIPATDKDEVTDWVKKKNPDYSALRLFSEMNPSTLEAWMTSKNGQGYKSTASLDLDPGKIMTMVSRNDFKFWGRHSPDRTDFLRMPTAPQMQKWIEAGHILIVRRIVDQHHYIWMTGHNGAGVFNVWDVGYSPGNAEFTASVTVGDLDQIFHWGPLPR